MSDGAIGNKSNASGWVLHRQQINGSEISKGAISMMVRVGWTRLTGLMAFSLLAFPLLVWAQKGDTGQLKAKVNPGRAGVFVDGKYLGPAANFRIARTYSLPAGEHALLLTEPRYKDITTNFTIQPGKTTVVKQVMEPLPAPKPPFGRLRIMQGSSGKFAAVYINGKYMGHVDEFSNAAQGLLISPGEYELRIASPGGGQDHLEKITIKENQTTTVKAGVK
jgi:hypothetical protein